MICGVYDLKLYYNNPISLSECDNIVIESSNQNVENIANIKIDNENNTISFKVYLNSDVDEDEIKNNYDFYVMYYSDENDSWKELEDYYKIELE